MTDQNLTEIICIIDRSGSMNSIRDDAIGGFNAFLKDQKRIKTDRCLLTYTQFDDVYEVVHDGKPIEDVPPLNYETYAPRGSTALLDAIGRTINVVGKRLHDTPEDQRPARVAVVILTDGQENASREFSRDQIKEMINTQRVLFNWEFIFLAAGQEAIREGQNLGMTNMAKFSHDACGVQDIHDNVSRAVSNYRGTGTMAQTEDALSDSGKLKH